jgi:hypothetical protein
MMFTVIIHSFWIVGLALLLAALSYHRYLAAQQGHHLRQQLGEASFQAVFYLSLVLVGIGLAGTSATAWEMALWVVLTVVATAGGARYVVLHLGNRE